MKTPITIIALMLATPVLADAPKGTIIFNPPVGHSGPPANNCAALYRKYPGQPSEALARRLNRQFAPCVWEPEKPMREPTPRPEPCIKRIEDEGGDIIYVPCDHVLTEGQSE